MVEVERDEDAAAESLSSRVCETSSKLSFSLPFPVPFPFPEWPPIPESADPERDPEGGEGRLLLMLGLLATLGFGLRARGAA